MFQACLSRRTASFPNEVANHRFHIFVALQQDFCSARLWNREAVTAGAGPVAGDEEVDKTSIMPARSGFAVDAAREAFLRDHLVG